MKTPKFWQNRNLIATILTPLGFIYGLLGTIRTKIVKPYNADIPVICVGNLTAGGSGKTPVCIAIAELLLRGGIKPFFLTRGYKGKLKNISVSTTNHSATTVGDEAVILSKTAPTVVNPNRVAGCIFAKNSGAEVVIMDDGFQNPYIEKDLSFLVSDGSYGFGNGKLIPAGPLREDITSGMKKADALIIVGNDTQKLSELAKAYNKTVIYAKIVPDYSAIKNFADKQFLAFAGIGIPEKFFRTLDDAGLNVVKTLEFADHHAFTATEIENIIKTAENIKAIPITTEKDFVRIDNKYKNKIAYLPINLVFDDAEKIAKLLSEKIRR